MSNSVRHDVGLSARAVPIAAIFLIFATFAIALWWGERLVGLELDDPWYMWFAWQANHGDLTDPLFGASGTQMFSRVWVELLRYAYVAGNWKLAAGHDVSLACVGAAAAIWFRLVQRLGFSRPQAYVVAALFVIYLPFLRAGLSARPEGFIWLLAALTLLLFDSGFPFLAGLAAGLAAETHPMGIVAIAYLVAWAWRKKNAPGIVSRRSCGLALAALILAFVGYLALHGGFLMHLAGSPNAQRIAGLLSFQTPVMAYLGQGNEARRLAAVLVILAGITIYGVTGTWKREKFPILLALCMGAAFLMVPRANQLYFVYFVPVPLLALVASLPSPRRLLLCLMLLGVPSLVAYAATIQANADFSEQGLEQRLHAELQGTNLPVFASADFWPALRCQANIASFSDFPAAITSGRPFYVLVEKTVALDSRLPPDTIVRDINMAPRADFLFYRVRPSIAEPPGAPHAFTPCN